jgi:dihydroxyacetone kinase-like protein
MKTFEEKNMVNADSLRRGMREIADIMAENRQYLIELDQRNGDGDLGISMAEGYAAAAEVLDKSDEKDLGKLMMASGKAFNEAAPSSLGTITSMGMMGMARTLRGNENADVALLAEAFEAGINRIMERAGSKPGEKTILDALYPAAKAMAAHAEEGLLPALEAASIAAEEGSKSTANMKAVHGRAAYYGDKTIGLIDGGAEAGRLMFLALYKAAKK